MRFSVGPHTYKLVMEAGPLTHQGDEVLALLDMGRRVIRMSEACPGPARLQVLIDRLARAWICHTAEPANAESFSRLAATCFVSILRDLERQGGEIALMCRGAKDNDDDAGSDRVFEAGAFGNVLDHTANAQGRTCFGCGIPWAPGNVSYSDPRFDRAAGKYVVDLSLLCEQCEDLQVWTEIANGRGKPTGVVVGEPKRMTGDAVRQWARKNPTHTTLRFVPEPEDAEAV